MIVKLIICFILLYDVSLVLYWWVLKETKGIFKLIQHCSKTKKKKKEKKNRRWTYQPYFISQLCQYIFFSWP